MVKFALASDHAGFPLKEAVKKILDSENIPYQDCGTDSDSSVDYPDYAKKAIQAVLEGRAEQGILVCGSGVGMSMVANRYPGIRAALVSEPQAAERSQLICPFSPTFKSTLYHRFFSVLFAFEETLEGSI